MTVSYDKKAEMLNDHYKIRQYVLVLLSLKITQSLV